MDTTKKQVMSREEYEEYKVAKEKATLDFQNSKKEPWDFENIILPLKNQKEWQKNYASSHIMYDQEYGCYLLEEDEVVGNTMRDGGSVIYTVKTLLEYFGIEKSILELGQLAIQYNCRINGVGTMHTFFDKLIGDIYGIHSHMIHSVNEIQRYFVEYIDGIKFARPVLIRLNASELYGKKISTGTTMLLVGIEDEFAVVYDPWSQIPVIYPLNKVIRATDFARGFTLL